jgi:hypothetical protein
MRVFYQTIITVDSAGIIFTTFININTNVELLKAYLLGYKQAKESLIKKKCFVYLIYNSSLRIFVSKLFM